MEAAEKACRKRRQWPTRSSGEELGTDNISRCLFLLHAPLMNGSVNDLGRRMIGTTQGPKEALAAKSEWGRAAILVV